MISKTQFLTKVSKDILPQMLQDEPIRKGVIAKIILFGLLGIVLIVGGGWYVSTVLCMDIWVEKNNPFRIFVPVVLAVYILSVIFILNSYKKNVKNKFFSTLLSYLDLKRDPPEILF